MAGIPGAGGKKGRSGRKSKAEEMGLAPLLNEAFPIEDRKAVIENLRRIATGHDDKVAVSAANLLLAYTYGKPKESVEHSGKDGEAFEIIVKHVTGTPQADSN